MYLAQTFGPFSETSNITYIKILSIGTPSKEIYSSMVLNILSTKLVLAFMLCGTVHNHTHKKSPHSLILNEVFTFGQQMGAFTSGQPFIELSKASNEELQLDKYSIIVYGVTRTGPEKLRVVIDLKEYGFTQNQNYVYIGDGSFPNKLLSTQMATSEGILFNDQFHPLNYLSVGNSQHLIVALLYSGEGK